jgi:hypothetical protein
VGKGAKRKEKGEKSARESEKARRKGKNRAQRGGKIAQVGKNGEVRSAQRAKRAPGAGTGAENDSLLISTGVVPVFFKKIFAKSHFLPSVRPYSPPSHQIRSTEIFCSSARHSTRPKMQSFFEFWPISISR